MLDISNNRIAHLENLSHLAKLEELWASSNLLDSFEEVERELAGTEALETVYLEANPLQLRGPAVYRNKVRLALPQVKQIDASEFATNAGDCGWGSGTDGLKSFRACLVMVERSSRSQMTCWHQRFPERLLGDPGEGGPMPALLALLR